MNSLESLNVKISCNRGITAVHFEAENYKVAYSLYYGKEKFSLGDFFQCLQYSHEIILVHLNITPDALDWFSGYL